MQWHLDPSESVFRYGVLKPYLKLFILNAETILPVGKNKGELSMKSLLFVLLQLTLVTIVYVFAYRAGYRSAQSKAMSVVRKFADPVTCLLDQLNGPLREAEEDERPTLNLESSTSNEKDVER
jgi:hypothetical protein